MSLITCPECGKTNVSSTAQSCPDCGFNIKEYVNDLLYEEEKAKEWERAKSAIPMPSKPKLNIPMVIISGILIIIGIATFTLFGIILIPMGCICLYYEYSNYKTKKMQYDYAVQDFDGYRASMARKQHADAQRSFNNRHTPSFAFQYIISFIIPLAGLIIGGILLSDKDRRRSDAGKTCIILGIISVIIGAFATCMMIWGRSSNGF